jgi:hypothetical protein
LTVEKLVLGIVVDIEMEMGVVSIIFSVKYVVSLLSAVFFPAFCIHEGELNIVKMRTDRFKNMTFM